MIYCSHVVFAVAWGIGFWLSGFFFNGLRWFSWAGMSLRAECPDTFGLVRLWRNGGVCCFSCSWFCLSFSSIIIVRSSVKIEAIASSTQPPRE